MLCFGGNLLINGSVLLAQKFKINKFIIGMTIIAYGTSLPELAASIAALGTHNDLILGNVLGSNISNIGMVLGFSVLISPLFIKTSDLKKQILIMFLVLVLFLILSFDGELSQYDGILLISSMLLFGIFLYLETKKSRSTAKDYAHSEKSNIVTHDYILSKKSSFISIVYIICGIILLSIGSVFTIDNIVIIAHIFSIPDKIIGLSIIAIGTSLPELITSLIAIRKKHYDIGLGNIIGSNIYNILIIIGISSLFSTITIYNHMYHDYAIMILFSIIFLFMLKKNMLAQKVGLLLFVMYVLYLLLLYCISFNFIF